MQNFTVYQVQYMRPYSDRQYTKYSGDSEKDFKAAIEELKKDEGVVKSVTKTKVYDRK